MSKSRILNQRNPVAEAAMAQHLEAIRRVAVDHSFAYDNDGLLTSKLNNPKYESWRTFLSNAYWSVDLK